MPTSSTRLRAYLGMDVAKLKLDVVLLLEERHTHRIFANTAEGFAALHAWIQEQGDFELSVCLESTGSYSDASVRFLLAQSYDVSVHNRATLVRYRKTKKHAVQNGQRRCVLAGALRQGRATSCLASHLR